MQTILVVEDNLALAQCLCIELETEGFVAETMPDGAQALKRLRQPGPVDLVLLDWDLPDFSGLELLQMMRKNNYMQPVMMLTAHNAIDHKVLALQSGADDYLAKPFSFDELQARIYALLRRSSSQNQTEKHLAGDKQVESPILYMLSSREREVLQHLGEGESNAEIGQALCISQETVKSHVKSLLHKLKAKDRTHAVVIAFHEGLVSSKGHSGATA
jgi:DNA-binding NarL/FixJ family response regulator